MSRRLENRYDEDPIFSNLVNSLYAFLSDDEHGITPLDLRDAAYFARLKFEMENPRPIIVGKDIYNHLDLLRARKF